MIHRKSPNKTNYTNALHLETVYVELRKTVHSKSENYYQNYQPSRIIMEKEMQMSFGQTRGRTISYALKKIMCPKSNG